MGIATYPDGGVDADAFMQGADAAMYRAKKAECGDAVHAAQPARRHSSREGTS